VIFTRLPRVSPLMLVRSGGRERARSPDSTDLTPHLVMQADGDLVDSGPDGQLVWQSATSSPGASLLNEPDGNLIIRATDGSVVWKTDYDPVCGHLTRRVHWPVRRRRSGLAVWHGSECRDGGRSIWRRCPQRMVRPGVRRSAVGGRPVAVRAA
jgi:hypothetical protein